MKNAIIFHGSGVTSQSFWIPSIKKHLESLGYEVWVPELTDEDNPELANWLALAMEGKYNEDTVIIGHSAGACLILGILEKLNVCINKAVLVAGWARPLKYDTEHGTIQLIIKNSYDWGKIKSSAKDIVYIHSNNDPWTTDDEEGLYMWRKTGGTLILPSDEGHMGSDSFEQPYTRFPLLEKLLELKYTRATIDGSDKK